jgi:hypothetical protein
MRNATRKKQRRSAGGRIGFQLAETMAAVSQMAMLCPGGLDALMRRELTDNGHGQGNGHGPAGPERQR